MVVLQVVRWLWLLLLSSSRPAASRREERSLLNTFPFNAADVELPVARQGAAPDALVDFASVAEANAAGRRCIDKVSTSHRILI
jgi:hypothetical protein